MGSGQLAESRTEPTQGLDIKDEPPPHPLPGLDGRAVSVL